MFSEVNIIVKTSLSKLVRLADLLSVNVLVNLMSTLMKNIAMLYCNRQKRGKNGRQAPTGSSILFYVDPGQTFWTRKILISRVINTFLIETIVVLNSSLLCGRYLG